MNSGQIGSLYNSTYTSLDTGKFMQNGQSGVTATETAKLNAPAANEVGTAVQTSDSLVSAQDLTAGQFISNALKAALPGHLPGRQCPAVPPKNARNREWQPPPVSAAA